MAHDDQKPSLEDKLRKLAGEAPVEVTQNTDQVAHGLEEGTLEAKKEKVSQEQKGLYVFGFGGESFADTYKIKKAFYLDIDGVRTELFNKLKNKAYISGPLRGQDMLRVEKKVNEIIDEIANGDNKIIAAEVNRFFTIKRPSQARVEFREMTKDGVTTPESRHWQMEEMIYEFIHTKLNGSH